MRGMKVNRLYRTRRKARIWVGFFLALAVTACQIHVLCQPGRHHPYKLETGENTAPVPRQDVYLPPW
jgi:hypothetical protein